MLTAAAAATLAVLASPAAATTYKVGTNQDELSSAGKCSLRDAIFAATDNNVEFGKCPEGSANKRDTIVLENKTYALTLPSSNEDANQNGDLDVAGGGPLTIKGAGAIRTEIRQDANDRVLDLVGTGTKLKLSKLTIEDGATSTLGGNIRVAGSNGALALNGVTVNSGDADSGGGIHAANDSKLTIKGSLLIGNVAHDRGGALATLGTAKSNISRSRLIENIVLSAGDPVHGGAIAHEALNGKMGIKDTLIEGNGTSASTTGDFATGGAIRSAGPLTITRSLLAQNAAVSTSTAAELGGAIFIAGNVATIVNTTFAGNTAGNNQGMGGAVYASAGTASLDFSTFFENQAPGGDADVFAAGPSASITYARSAFDSFGSNFACDGNVSSAGLNVLEGIHPPCNSAPSDDVGVGSNIGFADGLANNGGRTQTVALESSSAARDFIPKSECKGPSNREDQRGFERPAGPKCDAGAYERGAKKP